MVERGVVHPGTSPITEQEKTTEWAWVSAREAVMAFAIVATQFTQMIPFGAGINSALQIGTTLGVSQSESIWIAASYPVDITRMTQGAFVVVGGRLGMIYGHKRVATLAGFWWVITTLVSGFSRNLIVLCMMRAFSGVGAAFLLPNTLALLTIHFPPGKLRNLTVALFGAMAPVGAAGGSVWPGFFVQLVDWKWLFFFLAMLGAAVFTLFILVVPGENEPFDKGGSFDWLGGYLFTTGLVLFNFVWNQAPIVGWTSPYIYVLLIVSILHMVAFLVWSRCSQNPLIPFPIFTAPSFTPMILSALCTFMSVGIVIWYVEMWNTNLKAYTVFENAACYSTLAICGTMAAFASGKLVRVLPAQVIMAVGGIATLISNVLVATQSKRETYWAHVFPAVAVLGMGPDFIFTASQIIASNGVKRREQGIATSVIGTLATYGMSTGLGFASSVDRYVDPEGTAMIRGYRSALWLGAAFAALSATIAALFVRIPKDDREGWQESDI